jgi:hypothetical protein
MRPVLVDTEESFREDVRGDVAEALPSTFVRMIVRAENMRGKRAYRAG